MNSSWFYSGSRPPLQQQLLPNIWNIHRRISEEFIRYYYRQWDNNFPAILNLYSNPTITFLGHNMNNPYHIMNYFKRNGIYRFEHERVLGSSQPINNDSILINITGTIRFNNNRHNFIETLVIKRNNNNNCWYIVNQIIIISI